MVCGWGLLRYPGWLLRCCYAFSRVLALLLGCCHAVVKVPWVVTRVFLGGCYGTRGGC